MSLLDVVTPPAELRSVRSDLYITRDGDQLWLNKGNPYSWNRLPTYDDVSALTLQATTEKGNVSNRGMHITGAGGIVLATDGLALYNNSGISFVANLVGGAFASGLSMSGTTLTMAGGDTNLGVRPENINLSGVFTTKRISCALPVNGSDVTTKTYVDNNLAILSRTLQQVTAAGASTDRVTLHTGITGFSTAVAGLGQYNKGLIKIVPTNTGGISGGLEFDNAYTALTYITAAGVISQMNITAEDSSNPAFTFNRGLKATALTLTSAPAVPAGSWNPIGQSSQAGTVGQLVTAPVIGSGSLVMGTSIVGTGTVIPTQAYVDAAIGGGGASNLALGTITTTDIPVTNSNGTGLTIPSATGSLAGLLSATAQTIGGAKEFTSQVSILSGTFPQLLVSDNNTNSTNKVARYGLRHYLTAEEPVALILGAASSTGNEVYIGGGSATLNAATRIDFYTAADNVSTTGTVRMTISSSGLITMSNGLTVTGGSITGTLAGNATTATALATARTIFGISFTGAANVTGAASGITSLTIGGALTGATTGAFSGAISAASIGHATVTNGAITLGANGLVIARTVADANPAVIVNQGHASSTGDIVQWRWQNTRLAGVSYLGILDAGGLTTAGTVTAATVTASTAIKRTGAAGTIRGVQLQTAGVDRWLFGVENTAESGSNAGSNFGLYNYNDAGTLLSLAFSANRATGVSTFYNGLALSFTPPTGSGTLKALVRNVSTGVVQQIAPAQGGRYIASGNGATLSFAFAHGISGVTSGSVVTALGMNAASAGISSAVIDATNVTIVFAVAPASGTNNIEVSVIILP